MGPDLKLVYLVREPISRAISHHHHSFSAGKMPGKFEDALASHPELVDWGKYAMQACAWLEFYPAEQLKIIPFEEYVADRKKTVAEISQFLCIPSEVALIEEEKAFNNSKKLNLTRSLQILFPNLCHLTMSSPSLGQTSQTAYSGSQWSAIGNRVMPMSPTEFRR